MSKQTLDMITGFGVATADLPRLVRFYRDVLGFAADGEEGPISQAELALLGLSGAGRRQVMSLGRQTMLIDQFGPAGPTPRMATRRRLVPAPRFGGTRNGRGIRPAARSRSDLTGRPTAVAKLVRRRAGLQVPRSRQASA